VDARDKPGHDEAIDFHGDEFLQRAAGFFVVGGKEHFVPSSFRGARKASEPGISTLFNSSPDSGFALTRAPE
jgi:hypothetical protein